MAIYYADGSNSNDGRLIKVARGFISGNNQSTQVNATSWLVNQSNGGAEICQVNFTPKSATSKLLIIATGVWYAITGTEGHAMEAEVRIYDDTTDNTLAESKKTGYSYTGGHNRDSGDWTLTALIEADHNGNGTNQRTYNTWYKFDGNQTFYYGKQGDSITIYEIAASS